MGLIPPHVVTDVASGGGALSSLVPFSFAVVSCANLCGSRALLFDHDIVLPRYSAPIPN